MSHTLGKSQLHRRLNKLEADGSSKASLLSETGTYYRRLLLERARAIRECNEAARARGEEVPTPDPARQEMLRARFRALGYPWPDAEQTSS
jgi:hypothetical protein